MILLPPGAVGVPPGAPPELRGLLRGGAGRDDRPGGDRGEVRGSSTRTDPWYMHLYRNSYAYHGVHPFYMWYWGAHAMEYLGDVIFVGADREAVRAWGSGRRRRSPTPWRWPARPSGRRPSITYLHYAAADAGGGRADAGTTLARGRSSSRRRAGLAVGTPARWRRGSRRAVGPEPEPREFPTAWARTRRPGPPGGRCSAYGLTPGGVERDRPAGRGPRPPRRPEPPGAVRRQPLEPPGHAADPVLAAAGPGGSGRRSARRPTTSSTSGGGRPRPRSCSTRSRSSARAAAADRAPLGR